MTEREQVEQSISALEAQRPHLGDAIVDTALGPMREKLAALDAASQPMQQRKLATVLFADVSGFTALSETMDAEVVAGVMNDLWVLVDEAISSHGGRIDKHIGDAVMAIWGADTATENDPEMAVRAALEMQAAIEAFCTTHDIPLAMRIGVNTGPMILGRVGTTGEFTAMGDAVNLASRLEHAAPVDGVLISHDTYRHIRGIFDVIQQEPLTVKGKVEPVQTYIVLQAKPRAFRMATRGIEGVETRMIGRDNELGALREAFADAMEPSETQVVTIVGEPGVGKSRLLYEFDNWLDLRPGQIFYFEGRSSPNLQHVPYSLFRDLFAFRFQVLDSDSTATALDKFRQGMAGILEAERADVVGHWLGFDFGSSEAVKSLFGASEFGAIARAYLTRYFRTLAAAEPVVILLEDIHWADDSSLDLAAYLPAAIPEAKLLLIAVTRPNLFERRPGWGEGEAAFRRVNLVPLSKRASQALVDEILQRVGEVPDKLRSLVVDAAEGNPFYVEEMVKMLIDQGVILRGGAREQGSRGEALTPGHSPPAARGAIPDRWTVHAEKLEGLKVPPTLTGLLQARLDGLPRPEREALQRAAVVGRLFWDDCVAELLESERTAVQEILAAVRERELIFRRERSAFAEADEYIFKHALLRDVAYETVLLKDRAEFHGRVARWLEARAGERRDEYLGLIAEHYVQAGEGLQAAALLEQSAHEALEVGDAQAARQALERALALREAAGETRGPVVTRALIALGEAYWLLGDYPAGEVALERGLAGARAASDPIAEAEALAHLADVALTRGHFDRARALVEAALPARRDAGGPTLAVVLRSVSNLAFATGDLSAAETTFRELLATSRAMGGVTWESHALMGLGNVAASQRDLEQAELYYHEALTLARRANNLVSETTVLSNLGNLAYRRGDYLAALRYAQAVLPSFRQVGNQFLLLVALGNLAQANLRLGDLGAARQGAGEVLALARTLGNEADASWAVFLCGQILLAEDEPARCLAFYGLSRANPALDNQTRIEIDEELARLDLPPEQIEAGLAAGAMLDFETVVQEILDGKW